MALSSVSLVDLSLFHSQNHRLVYIPNGVEGNLVSVPGDKFCIVGFSSVGRFPDGVSSENEHNKKMLCR